MNIFRYFGHAHKYSNETIFTLIPVSTIVCSIQISSQIIYYRLLVCESYIVLRNLYWVRARFIHSSIRMLAMHWTRLIFFRSLLLPISCRRRLNNIVMEKQIPIFFCSLRVRSDETKFYQLARIILLWESCNWSEYCSFFLTILFL